MNRRMLGAAIAVVAGVALTSSGRTVSSHDRDHEDGDDSRIRKGFEISPVKLRYHRANREWVGLGSYIVNAQGACADCHTCPTYAHGGNPYAGQKTIINADDYLAGGGTPLALSRTGSANITPTPTESPSGSPSLISCAHAHRPQPPGPAGRDRAGDALARSTAT